MHAYTYTHTAHTRTHTHARAHMHTHTRAHTHARTHMHARTHTNTYTNCTDTQMHITHMCRYVQSTKSFISNGITANHVPLTQVSRPHTRLILVQHHFSQNPYLSRFFKYTYCMNTPLLCKRYAGIVQDSVRMQSDTLYLLKHYNLFC